MASLIRAGLVATRAQFPHTPIAEQSVSGEVDLDTTLEKLGVTNKSKEAILSTGSVTPVTVSSETAN